MHSFIHGKGHSAHAAAMQRQLLLYTSLGTRERVGDQTLVAATVFLNPCVSAAV